MKKRNIADYLGKHVSILLSASPFIEWPVERSEDADDARIIHYSFPQNGIQLRCDSDEHIGVVFLKSDELHDSHHHLLPVPFSYCRRQVLEQFGSPSKSGGSVNDPILGSYGAWDRFLLPSHCVHIEYAIDADCIKRITLMREDVIP